MSDYDIFTQACYRLSKTWGKYEKALLISAATCRKNYIICKWYNEHSILPQCIKYLIIVEDNYRFYKNEIKRQSKDIVMAGSQ